MNDNTIERMADMVKGKSVAGPVADDIIQQAEQTLGRRFPASYRQFLLHFGAVTLGYFEIFGLSKNAEIDGPPLWVDVVQATRQARRAGRGTIPDEYIAFTSDGQGCKFYLDTSRTNEAGDCPVIAWGPGVDGVTIAPTFLEFMDRASQGKRLT